MSAEPLISVITVCRNPGAVLEGCLDSVAAQDFDAWEQVVIDGASEDGTPDLLAAREEPSLRWWSEPDGGIADAMNRGVRRARGRWLYFLQADDRIASSATLGEVARLLPDGNGPAMMAFPVLRVESDGREEWIPVRLGRAWRKMPACHQGIFFRRKLFERYGLYQTRYRLCMDYELVLRFLRAGERMGRGELAVARYGGAGVTSSPSRTIRMQRHGEEREIHFAQATRWWWRAVYRFYWGVYPAYRRVRDALCDHE